MNVLVVDMLEGFTRTGVLSSPRVAALIPKQVEFLNGIPSDSFIVFACDSHKEYDSEFKRMPVHCMEDTVESQICPELLEVCNRRGLEYRIVKKRTHSPFFETDLDEILRYRAIYTYSNLDDWVVIGCVTDICITAAVMELDYRGKNVTVYRDLVDTYEITDEQSLAICGSHVKQHNPEEFNRLFLDRYLPGVWGVNIV